MHVHDSMTIMLNYCRGESDPSDI